MRDETWHKEELREDQDFLWLVDKVDKYLTWGWIPPVQGGKFILDQVSARTLTNEYVEY